MRSIVIIYSPFSATPLTFFCLSLPIKSAQTDDFQQSHQHKHVYQSTVCTTSKQFVLKLSETKRSERRMEGEKKLKMWRHDPEPVEKKMKQAASKKAAAEWFQGGNGKLVRLGCEGLLPFLLNCFLLKWSKKQTQKKSFRLRGYCCHRLLERRWSDYSFRSWSIWWRSNRKWARPGRSEGLSYDPVSPLMLCPKRKKTSH